jgi:hypothetical protein
MQMMHWKGRGGCHRRGLRDHQPHPPRRQNPVSPGHQGAASFHRWAMSHDDKPVHFPCPTVGCLRRLHSTGW